MKIYIIGAVVLIVIVLIISSINKIKHASIKVAESSSGIDIALAKRYDVLTKMAEVVKGYAKHEKDVLLDVVKLRKGMSINEKNDANAKMDQTQERINIIAESYPTLKADKNFLLLQKSIIEVEEHLSAARRLYNSNVSHYNQLIELFPTSIIASLLHKETVEFFKATNDEKNNFEMKI